MSSFTKTIQNAPDSTTLTGEELIPVIQGNKTTKIKASTMQQSVLKGDVGAQGEKGDTGPPGAPGSGMPTGGFSGQLLAKATDDDYALTWKDPFDTYAFEDMQDPTGWVDPTNIVSTYDSSARTITLTHPSGLLFYEYRGERFFLVSPWVSSAHPSSLDTRYFLYSTDGQNFNWSTTVWTFNNLMVSSVYYGTSDKFDIRETHGLMPWTVHQEFHELMGTYRESGGALTAGTYTENSATDANTTPGFDAAITKDEDLITTIPAWTQGTYTTMRIGAANAVVFDTTASFPFRSSGSYILVNNPSTGAETAGSNNQFVNVYQILIPCGAATNSQKYRMVMLQPQTAYGSLAGALAEDSRSLSIGTLTATSLEFVVYARITYSLNAGDGSTGKCRIAIGGVSYVLGTRQGQTTGTAFAPVTDATIAITDITTNDASTTKHGWLPKLSNNPTDALKGDGTWGAVGGGGGGTASPASQIWIQQNYGGF